MSWLTRLFGSGRRRLLASAAAVLLLASAGGLALGFAAQHHPPQPPASAALPAAGVPNAASAGTTPSTSPAPASPSPAATPAAPATPTKPAAPATPTAAPTAISIPEIGVHHTLIQLGQNSDGTIQTPPLTDPSIPGWYRYSPAPGQVGPSVIVGHIDGTTGAKGVFYNLGALRPGDTVDVSRSDDTVAVFRIDGINKYAKSAFPTATVYGNTTNPQLRLITCAGPFENQHYLDDIVVYASLTAIHPA
ncbi:peptidase C60 sortase A and B [Catenulispora acidiphila DSM 44928]|uniref:Peptidase C60 sortase A and B n=1 Tax=Catenulispora acidiphila (strain DSM 44928 / JCM 14897 / NBRC 102108 / NRRL B-24433 / ID139908) TaxID=479433 RepID=C7QAI0_CATAD|nr:class F sortase [Catenulispora acidiphila]ACU72479.1 peptidase C60 sortase A and B [Catenulispora acidiphila DSM 44928]